MITADMNAKLRKWQNGEIVEEFGLESRNEHGENDSNDAQQITR